MNEINKTLSQLLSMLRTAESNTKGWIQTHSIKSAKRKERKVIRSKVNGKTKTKGKWIETHGDISKDESVSIMKSLVNEKETALFFLKKSRKLKAVRGSVSSIYIIDDDTKYQKT